MPRPPEKRKSIDVLCEGKSIPGGRPIGFTAGVKTKYLANLRKTANLSAAAEATAISPATVLRHRKAFPSFDEQVKEALEYAMDMLEGECRRRAFNGTKKPVFYKGKEVGTITEYSDTLAMFLLKGGRPEKFRERTDVNYQGSIEIRVVKFGSTDIDTKQLETPARPTKALVLLGGGGDAGSGSSTPTLGQG